MVLEQAPESGLEQVLVEQPQEVGQLRPARDRSRGSNHRSLLSNNDLPLLL